MRTFTLLILLLAASLLRSQTPLAAQLVATGLQVPVFATAPANDFARVFIVEQTGRIRIVKNGALLPTPFLNLSGQISYGGERGLLGLAFHPDYATNGRFYIYVTVNPYLTAAVRSYQVSASNPDLADPASATTLLSVPMVYGNHNGGMIGFGPDRMLYVAFGDGGSIAPSWPSDPFNHAQRGDSLLGKLLRLDVDHPNPPLLYGIPANNPFVGAGDPRDEIWAMGLRNPWRFSFDRLTGDLWLADVGGQREEVNFVPVGTAGGQNYGWSCLSGTFCVNTGACVCTDPLLVAPLYEYTATTSRAIIGGYVYRGAAIPDLRGSYFYADYSLGIIQSFQRSAVGVAQLTDRTTELAPAAPYQRVGVSSFGEDGSGELLICDLGGQVYRIVPNAPIVVGVSAFGTGTAGCNGPHLLAAPSSPVIGNNAFELRCDHAPGFGFGALVLGSSSDPVGSDPFGIGALVHIGLNPPPLAVAALFADSNGAVRYPLPLPPWTSLIGWSLHAQAAWYWPASCAALPGGWSTSHGLSLILQP